MKTMLEHNNTSKMVLQQTNMKGTAKEDNVLKCGCLVITDLKQGQVL